MLLCKSLTLCPFPLYAEHKSRGQELTGHKVQFPLLPTAREKRLFINFLLKRTTLNTVRLFASATCAVIP